MNTKHTPTPWKLEIFDTHCFVSGIKDRDEVISIPYSKLDEANAKLIVRAVNSHALLVEALRMARIALTPHVFIDDDAKRARNKADEALKQAEEL